MKLCKDCKWFLPDATLVTSEMKIEYGRCGRSKIRNHVTGERQFAKVERLLPRILDWSGCGSAGRYWEPIPPPYKHENGDGV